MRKGLYLLIGVVLGAMLSRPAVLDAASNLMLGSFGNATKAVAVTSGGAVIVTLN